MDFLGTSVPLDYFGLPCHEETISVSCPYPAVDEDVFAWIDLLESVQAARGSFRMIELGAGFGIWSMRGMLAALQKGLPCRACAVEAEPTHFRWLVDSFRRNGLNPDEHRLIHAAVAERPGSAWFYFDTPWYSASPRTWWGQAVVQDEDGIDGPDGSIYEGQPVMRTKYGCRAVEVPTVTVEALLAEIGSVDFIHVDLQGAELEALRPAMEALDQRVGRINIGTHSSEIEDGLRALFRSHGWKCVADYSLGSSADTPYGRISFVDGVQGWIR
jgi:FkbM family methyltransferase